MPLADQNQERRHSKDKTLDQPLMKISTKATNRSKNTEVEPRTARPIQLEVKHRKKLEPSREGPPQQGKPALWELDSDQHYSVGRHGPNLINEDARKVQQA
ncbi:hypothetical protein GOBAR_DD16784 [Gossypium barbadense]|nr:hypothetical protein GOBAR_DD16784 [Gossypium barbadense]